MNLPNTTAQATAANVRRGQERTARRLREAGWLVLSPDEFGDLPPLTRNVLAGIMRQQAAA